MQVALAATTLLLHCLFTRPGFFLGLCYHINVLDVTGCPALSWRQQQGHWACNQLHESYMHCESILILNGVSSFMLAQK